MNRISPEFVETRRRALDRYLSRVVLHPELSDSILLAVFLQGDDAALARAKEEAKQNKPKLASSAVSWLEGTVISLASGKVKRFYFSSKYLPLVKITRVNISSFLF